MNAREFFYKGYYLHSIGQQNNVTQFSLEKPAKKEDFNELKKKNKPVIEDANRKLQNFTLQNAAPPKNDYQCLRLNTDNNIWLSEIVFTTSYPGLLIGTGYMHQSDNEAEFKMGFYFDHTTGLPCIPGSSVKGVLRSMFPQLGRKLNILPQPQDITDVQHSKIEHIAQLAGWDGLDATEMTKKVHCLELAIFEGADLDKTPEGGENEYKKIYNRFIFYNAYISGAKGNKIFETDSIAPHPDPLKNPIPLNFLKIRASVKFNFQFLLQDIKPLGLSRTTIMEIFKALLEYTGAGAKTNVGYGQLKYETHIMPPGEESFVSELSKAFDLLHTLKLKKRKTN
ncbi:MAG TPA: type III-B CRISPR module RAMP protein Cmr6 [Chitinophagaceae bacterium]|nr:type III-B CRISPR module RAMP protein Cmr6 [Chitinophagaceae bacterium]HNU16083.1 type III-B CRISPR module RAMP protein Cmr6 [Chitinophagaceae bacterium]